MSIRVAVDAMGGDKAPSVVIEGAIRAMQQAAGDLHLLLFGPEATLREALAPFGSDAQHLEVVDAPDVIGMGESPVSAVKLKPQSSIHRGLEAVKTGRADAFVSAGNTGAVVAASLFVLGRLPGVARPTLPGFFPTTKGLCFVLDVGSNVDSKPEHLVQFAQMGAVYAERIHKVENPSVALMNIGEEPGKGNELVKATYPLLEQLPRLNFRGNAEGSDILTHGYDVIVCDGFIGNILLKFGESIASSLTQLLRQEVARQGLSEEQALLVKKVFGGIQKQFNPEEFGGLPLLGVDGNVLIGHGSSSAKSITSMITAAVTVVELQLKEAILDALAG